MRVPMVRSCVLAIIHIGPLLMLIFFSGMALAAEAEAWAASVPHPRNQTVPPANFYLRLPRIVDSPIATNLTHHSAFDYSPAWSPDNSKIAFVSDRDGNAELFVMDADGSNLRQFTHDLLPPFDTDRLWSVGEPAWSPAGSRIAFTLSTCFGCSEGGHQYFRYRLYVIDADGSNLVLLRDSATRPIWSPDGSKLLYEYPGDYTTPFRSFGVVNGDGSGATYLMGGQPPHWSPDGSRVLFASDVMSSTEVYNSEIFTMNADGSNLVNLTNSAAYEHDPQWSPDGSKILFSRQSNETRDLYVMDGDGNNQIRLTDTFRYESGAQWSPDGSRIIYVAESNSSECCHYNLYLLNLNSGIPQKLFSNVIYPYFPITWSADGRKINFRAESSQSSFDSSFVLFVDSGEWFELTTFQGSEVWSPSGITIAFVYEGDIWLYNL